MKLAFCLFNYFPYGGLQRDFMRIAQECLKRGHTIDVFTMHWEGEKHPSLSITILPATGFQNHTRAKKFAQQVQQQLAKNQYDLILGFNKMPGLDVYYAADTCYQARVNKKNNFLYRLLPRYQSLVAAEKSVFAEDTKTQILLISPLQKNEFVRYYQTPENRFHLLPPGIEKNRIAPENSAELREKTRAELGIKSNEFLLLMVGSGFKTKGLDRGLLALAALPEDIKNRTQLYVIGKDDPATFQAQAKKLDIHDRVKFLGGRDDVPRFLLAADLLLHPAYNENTGTVLLEAVVSGLPVLTTDICGYAHYIIEANAGRVLPSPFQQQVFNQTLQNMLLSLPDAPWQTNGLAFAKAADIYSMPERAVDLLEKMTC